MAKLDPRNHRSLVDDEHLEWIGKLTQFEKSLLLPLMYEAEEFADEDLMRFCMRSVRLGAAVGGRRAEMMARVAMHDEAKRDTIETRSGATSPEVPRGP